MANDAKQLSSVNFYAEESNRTANLGQRGETQDGRIFRYVLAGGTTLIVGELQQAATEDTNFKDMAAQAAAAIGATTVPVTLGGTATAVTETSAGNLIGGLLVVSATPGIGQYSRIISHDTQATTTGTCNIVIEDPLTVATSTSSLITAYRSPHRNIIVHVGSATTTGMSVGVANKAITNGKFGWVQTGGLGACLSDATVSTASIVALSPSVGTAGAVTKAITLVERIGLSYPVASVNARVEPIWLQID